MASTVCGEPQDVSHAVRRGLPIFWTRSMTLALIRAVTDKLMPQRPASMPFYDDEVSDEYLAAQRNAIARVLPEAEQFASGYDFRW